jgi:hypothetical protein
VAFNILGSQKEERAIVFKRAGVNNAQREECVNQEAAYITESGTGTVLGTANIPLSSQLGTWVRIGKRHRVTVMPHHVSIKCGGLPSFDILLYYPTHNRNHDSDYDAPIQ